MITDKKIEKLKVKAKRYTVALGESLYLRVQSSGHKSWVLRYSYCGRVRDITLGTWPELKVLQAKQAAPGVDGGIANSGEPDVKCPFSVKVDNLGADSAAFACM